MSEDAISRDAVLDACSQSINILDAMSRIEDLPSVKPKPCEDAISRQAAIEEIRFGQSFITKIHPTGEIEHLFDKENKALEAAVERINALPSVTPKQRTGHWKEVYAETDYRDGWIEFSCENCEYQHGLESGEYGWSYGDPIPWKYCPICGAKMVEPQESEE